MKRFFTLAIAGFLLLSCLVQCQSDADRQFARLKQEFTDPPASAKPRVWWHWMNGNVTTDGIRKDLLWMHQSGIGGFQNFDAGLFTPQIVENRLTYMTPEWKEAFALATRLADSLNLEMAIAGSPGWSQTGGPWVEPKDGMKKLVWREFDVTGGNLVTMILPDPYRTTGDFQNMPPQADFSAQGEGKPLPQYYGDIAVLAFRMPGNGPLQPAQRPKVTSSGGRFTYDMLNDGDLGTAQLLPTGKGNAPAWIQYEYPTPQTVKSLQIAGGGTRETYRALPPAITRSLEVSNDGKTFTKVLDIPLGGAAQQTLSFPDITARFFRVNIQNPPQPFSEFAELLGSMTSQPAGTHISELILHSTTRINHAEEKAGFAATFDIEKYPTPEAGNDAIATGDVIDLTKKMKEDGSLTWQAPEGNWKIMRLGYSLTGKQNHPASPEATGLEVDKLDARAVKDYFENYLDQYKEATGGLMGAKGLQYLVTDSYEAGQMTWTPAMADEFSQRRGYSLIPWLPVLTGHIIESTEASEQFLWDWRKTIGELIAENHYDQLTTILEGYGMKRYTESHENGRLYIVDGMDVKRTAAVPMSAMWMPGGSGSSLAMAQADIRESASVAHIYGQNLVAAESLTAFGLGGNAWSFAPENLKSTADLELASGLNRFVIHTSVHQPVDDKIPGLGLFVFGQWFNRHETWANQAKAWTDYLARSSHMLQQGTCVADIVYYYGEDNNITGLYGHRLPEIPKGYSYDFINAHALTTLLTVSDRQLVTPSGMRYKVLALGDNTKRMSLPVLRKIAQLVGEGAFICGLRPEVRASRTDDAEEFNRLVEGVWNTGKPNVSQGEPIGEVLAKLGVEPDFEYRSPTDSTQLLFVHRHLTDTDIYWVNNRTDRNETVEATFRVKGRKPEIWHPETGKMEPASYRKEGKRTIVTLDLVPNDAVFVVFAEPSRKSKVTLPKSTETPIMEVNGDWKVAFQTGRGAPAEATFTKLLSYTGHSDPGIKYFSGEATYSQTIDLPEKAWAEGTRVMLDLGEVKNLAEVNVNGTPLGIVWKKPFRMDVTEALRAGSNELKIKVVNLWVNRLIGDMQPDATRKVTFTAFPFYKADAPLQPSGLLGPVRLVAVQ